MKVSPFNLLVPVLLAFALHLRAAERPNIVFIFSDDHSSRAISAYGSKINETPHMDRIAKEGMLFRNCFVSNAICGPSRAVIQTGKYSHLNGFIRNGNTFDGSQQTFPKLLQKGGYQTAVVGKWHLKSVPTGFDYSEVLIGQGPYYNPPMLKNGEKTQHTGYTTEIITDLAIDWLKESRDPNKPFMLMYQHKAPHRNWQPGPGYLNMYDDVEIPEPETLFEDYANLASPAKNQTMTIAHHLNEGDLKLKPPRGLNEEQLTLWNAAYEPKNQVFRDAKLEGKALVKWKYQRYIKDYLRCVASVDDNIGRVLKYLDDNGLAENTIVIYCSDQGWYLGENGWFDKRWIYDVSLRMPFMIKWPGVIKPGSENADTVSNIDFAQTFLDIAGVEQPSDMQGASLVPLFKGQTPADWRKSFYYQYYEFPGGHSVARHYGVRTDDYTLVHYYHLDEWELFDNRKDPHQVMSVYNNPEYGEVVKKMQVEIERLRTQYEVPVDPKPEPKAPRKKKRMRRLAPENGAYLAEDFPTGLWFQTVWLYLLPTAQQAVWDNPFFWLGLIYVTFPLNFLVYGWNDIVDFHLDKENPRKDSWLFGARASMDQLKKIPVPMVMAQVPFFAMFAVLDPLRGFGTIAGIMLTNFLYNDSRIALRGRPPFDLLNPLGYLIILYLGIWLNQTVYVSWLAVAYLGLFCVHAHLMGEIMDFRADKDAGRKTSAQRLGMRGSKGLVAALVLIEAAMIWFGFGDLWLAGFLLIGFAWLLLDLLVLFPEGEYTPKQFRWLGIFMNVSSYGSITYLWVSGGLRA